MPSGQLNADILLTRFGGRVNVPQVKDFTFLQPHQSPLSRNVDTTGESIRKMRGFSKITTTPVAGDISSLHYDPFTDNVYVGYEDKLGKLTGTTVTQLTGATGFANNSIWSFCRVADFLVAMNGVDTPQLWDEDTSTLIPVTTPPVTWGTGAQPHFCTNWMGRAFAAGVDGQQDILFYSELYDASTWTPGVTATSGGALTIGRDGVAITAVYPLADGLLIFKDPGLYYLRGSFDTNGNFDSTTFDWKLLSNEVDAHNFRSVVATSDSVFALGRRAVWLIHGTQAQQGIECVNVSRNIAFDIGQIVENLDQISSVHYSARNQIWFAVSKNNGSSQIDTVYAYDYVNLDADGQGQWFLRDGYSHKCHAMVRDVAGAYQIYSGGYANTGLIYKQNDTTDYDGLAIPCTYYTSWIPLVGLPTGKPVLSVISLGPQTVGPISYSYAYDFANSDYDALTLAPDSDSSTWNTGGGSTWGTGGGSTGTWTSGESSMSTNILFGQGRRIQHRFHSNLLGSDFAILEIKHPSITVGYR